jgi:crossover junction endodeoxyribonuclease RusA
MPLRAVDVEGPDTWPTRRFVAFEVPGVPRPQGSKRAVHHARTGKIVLLEASSELRAWREDVTMRARMALRREPTILGPVRLSVRFVLPRPQSVSRAYPAVRPDLDKLVRAIGDALTAAGVYRDDSQICSLDAAKVYAARDGTGAWIKVQELAR